MTLLTIWGFVGRSIGSAWGRAIGAVCATAFALSLLGCSRVERDSESVRASRSQLTVPGLVAAYGFDEGSGATVVDATGNGNDSELAGQQRLGGKYGGALRFEGNRLTVADAPSFHLEEELTLSAWVFPKRELAYWTTAVMKQDGNWLSY